MSIGPISGAAGAVNAVASKPPAPSTGADGFGDMVAKGVENLEQVQSKADDLAVQAATGDLTDVHDYMIASTQASIATELTVAVRNRAVEAFNEIMRMPV